MFIYILFLFILSILGIYKKRITILNIIILFFVLVLFIGFRYEVGTDWQMYLLRIDSRGDQSLSDLLKRGMEIGFASLESIAYTFGRKIVIVNTLSGIIFIYGLIKYCKKQAYPWLALLIAYPVLILLVSICNPRQAQQLDLS